MYSFLLACIKHYIQAFSRNVGDLREESCLSRILCFFKQLVDIHPVCSLDFSGNRLFIRIKDTDSHRLGCNGPPSDPYSSLFCTLFFKIYLRFISFLSSSPAVMENQTCFYPETSHRSQAYDTPPDFPVSEQLP